jgi:hypothetical protein
MGERKELGSIKKADFGWGGYQDAMLGFSFELGGQSWGVSDFKGAWGIERTDRAQWTEADRIGELGNASLFVRELLTKAKKQRVAQLVGVPIEVTFESNTLKSWRVLEEVL